MGAGSDVQPRKNWTPREVDTLMRLWSRGDSATQIAAKMRRTVDSVGCMASRIGLQRYHREARAELVLTVDSNCPTCHGAGTIRVTAGRVLCRCVGV